MKIRYASMKIDDYDAVVSLWQQSPGIGLSAADEPEAIAQYLARNTEMSTTAWDGSRLVGAVLCGHDGRRGFIHHLAVAKSHSKMGIGSSLVAHCLDSLAQAGIEKCHIFVYGENQEAIEFWKWTGWIKRHELIVMSKDIELDA